MRKGPTHFGIAISPGVVVAPAYVLPEIVGRTPGPPEGPVDRAAELARFHAAFDAAAASLEDLIHKSTQEIGDRGASIFRVQLVMLRDRAFVSKVTALILEGGRDASTALRETMAEYEQLFSKVKDTYLRERIVDLRDVVARVQRCLAPAEDAPEEKPREAVILVAQELFPSQAVTIDRLKIAGIVTERGGAAGHAAIIARSLGIPAVGGVPGILSIVETGDLLAIDGREGSVIVQPGPEAEAAFRKLQREFVHLRELLVENRDQPAVTTDGHAIELLANISNASDAKSAADVGAVGIGLYRTEYFFITHPSIPSEEELVEVYREVLAESPGRRLTVRTLDLGGDKTVPYLGAQREANPFLGWRSIRLSLDHVEFFRKQLRAILRAGDDGDVSIMFPMISTVEELRRARRLLFSVRRELDRDGVRHAKNCRIGMMLEVPAAAICLDQLIGYADFVSIGTNDLVQYLLAADRDNPKVAHLCDPLSPSVLRVIHRAITICRDARKPLSACGEMAGRPRGALVLLALGMTSLSMSPAFVPIVKELVRDVDLAKLQAMAQRILEKSTAALVRRFLQRELERVCPRIAQLEPAST